METRFRLLLLTCVMALSGCAAARPASDAPGPTPVPAEPGAVIAPEVARREVRVVKVEPQDWEMGAFIGSMSVEDFGAHFVYGGRVAYHVTEDVFAEATVGASEAGTSSYERGNNVRLLTKSERRLRYYNLGFGWNVLPGEVYFGGNRAYNSALYLAGGIGSTRFAGDERFTVTLGGGARVMLQDGLSLRIDVRDHILAVDLLGENRRTHNFEATLSVTGFF